MQKMAIPVLVTLLSYLFCTSHASTTQFSPSSSSSSSSFSNNAVIATEQIKLWAQNVDNKMPQSIINKLSPLTKQQSNLFTPNIHSENNGKRFKFDAKFCSLANLACGSALDKIKVDRNYLSSNTKNENDLASRDGFVFFRLSGLKAGNILHLPAEGESLPDRAFLPHEIASNVSLASVNDIMKLFGSSSSWNTGTRDVVKITLSNCNADPIQDEIKSCPKSLEEVISFSQRVLGDERKSKLLRVMTSESNNGWNKELLIKNVKKYSADKIVACHELPLQFAIYYCHILSWANLYHVDFVEPNSGVAINKMLAICHMKTTAWPQAYVAFQILKFRPGEGEICHWLSANELAWITSN